MRTGRMAHNRTERTQTLLLINGLIRRDKPWINLRELRNRREFSHESNFSQKARDLPGRWRPSAVQKMRLQLRSAPGESRWRRFSSDGVAGKATVPISSLPTFTLCGQDSVAERGEFELPVPIVNGEMTGIK